MTKPDIIREEAAKVKDKNCALLLELVARGAIRDHSAILSWHRAIENTRSCRGQYNLENLLNGLSIFYDHADCFSKS